METVSSQISSIWPAACSVTLQAEKGTLSKYVSVRGCLSHWAMMDLARGCAFWHALPIPERNLFFVLCLVRFFLYIACCVCCVQHVISTFTFGMCTAVISHILFVFGCFIVSASVPNQGIDLSYKRSWSRIAILFRGVYTRVGFSLEAIKAVVLCEHWY